MIKIEIRNINKTSLNEEAFRRFVKKYAQTNKDIVITFDGRIKDCGWYLYNSEKKRHEIKIGIKSNKTITFTSSEERELKVNDQKFVFIETTLHEIKHLLQKDCDEKSFYSNDFSINKEIKDNIMAVEYSKCELEAKEFEKKNILAAVEFYDKVVEKLERKK